MKVGIKGKGEEIKWIDETELDLYKEFEKYKLEQKEKYDKLVKSHNELIRQLKGLGGKK